ncbi:MAG: UvrD-helicase domain-containing protein, partial [Clostridia bacterium]|nr:UvrD-helicase domain-containing protein [Clostridia bacterium]
MFDFGRANEAQRRAIESVEGPVLIIAGPGTGKTYTLVQRVVYLIEVCGVKPEEILISTFTQKAAKELVTRVTDELSKRGIDININDMYIGTIHTICRRIIEKHAEHIGLKKNYIMLDDFAQKYLVFRNLKRFRRIEGFDDLMINRFEPRRQKQRAWEQAVAICQTVNRIEEERVDPSHLMADDGEKFNGRNLVSVIGQIAEVYRSL